MIAKTVFVVLVVLAGVFSQQQTKTFTRDATTFYLNPERGFYSTQETQSDLNGGVAMTDSDLRAVRNKNITLILRNYYIREYKNSLSLSQNMLNMVATDFSVVRRNGMKSLIRFAYSQGTSEADANMTVIQSHLTQLAPIIKNNTDVIAGWQAGFIGAYGEWYYSTSGLNNNASYTQLVKSLLAILPNDRTIMVRTPKYKQDMFNIQTSLYSTTNLPNNGRVSDYSRVGLHDDCFVADATDQGTYVNSWDRTFTANDTLFVPNGGETCATSSFSTCSGAFQQMTSYHISYMNNDYHPGVISSWKTGGCYDTMMQRMGYRLSITSISYPSTIAVGATSLPYTIVVNNNGTAAPFNQYNVKLSLALASNVSVIVAQYTLGDDVRVWIPETPAITITGNFPLSIIMVAGTQYTLLLSICDVYPSLSNNPNYCIRLANTDVTYLNTGAHNLGTTTTVVTSTTTSAPTPTSAPM